MLSPFANLQEGFDAYEVGLHQRGGLISQTRRKERKLAREVGPVRFEMHTADEEVFKSLRAWQAIQYERARYTSACAAATRCTSGFPPTIVRSNSTLPA